LRWLHNLTSRVSDGTFLLSGYTGEEQACCERHLTTAVFQSRASTLLYIFTAA